MKDSCNLLTTRYYLYQEYDCFLALYCRSECILFACLMYMTREIKSVYKYGPCLSYHDDLIVQENILLTSVANRLNRICQWIVVVTVETKLILCLYVSGFEM